MFGKLRQINKIFTFSIVPAFSNNPFDKVSNPEKLPKDERTGWDRLYLMFSKDEFGELSPQLATFTHVLLVSMFTGGVIGGFIHSRNSFLNFVENNDTTKFTSHMEAKFRLQDQVTTGFGRGAFMWGWRLSAFTGTYTLISSSISVYRNKTGVLEHVIAGGVTGGLYKSNIGLKGVVVGVSLGTVLGVFSGCMISGLLKLSGKTMDDIWQVGHDVKSSREMIVKRAEEKLIESKEPAIVQEYSQKTKDKDVSLKSL